MTTTVDAPAGAGATGTTTGTGSGTAPATGVPGPAHPGPAHPGPSPVVVRHLAPAAPTAGPEPMPPSAPDPPHDRPAAGSRGPSRTELATVLRMVLEVLDGRRPPAQLADRVSPPVRRYLAAAVGRLDRPVPGRPTVRPVRCGPPGLSSVRTCEPVDGVCEVSAGWRYQGRHRALAARFEWTGGRWRCTALRLG